MTEEEKANLDEENEEESEGEDEGESGDEELDEKNEEESEGDDDESEDEDINPEDYEIQTRKEIKESSSSDDEDDDDVDPDDVMAINKVVDKKLGPLQQQIQQQNDEIEVNSYIVNNPEYAKYKPVILKYIASPAYSNIPVKNIAAIVAVNDMQKIGAKKEREASNKANSTKNRGSQARKSSGDVNWLNASKEEYEAKVLEVKGVRR